LGRAKDAEDLMHEFAHHGGNDDQLRLASAAEASRKRAKGWMEANGGDRGKVEGFA
jgi:hypothetical protein